MSRAIGLSPARPDDPRLADALTRACQEMGVTEYEDMVRDLMLQAPADWPICCGSACEPCIEIIVVAARRGLELLATPPPA